MDSFEGYLKRGELTPNKVGFLIDTFKETHLKAPQSDFDRLSGRMAGLYRMSKGNTGIILEAIWCSCSKTLQGSHLDYITISVKARMKANRMNQPKLEGHAGMETD
jgi:hypothetical protein